LAKSQGRFAVKHLELPHDTAYPDNREFVIQDLMTAADKAVEVARAEMAKNQQTTNTTPGKMRELELKLAVAEAKVTGLIDVLRTEVVGRLLAENKRGNTAMDGAAFSSGILQRLELTLWGTDDASGQLDLSVLSNRWQRLATNTVSAQRTLALREAKLKFHEAETAEEQIRGRLNTALEAQERAEAPGEANATKLEAAKAAKDAEKAAKDLEAAKKKSAEAAKALAEAQKESQAPLHANFKPRPVETYPSRSTGRRLAFARWVADRANPLTARVAMNHIWLRHFGRGIVPTPADFGRNGRAPSHPELLDWLAAELMDQGWSMKAMHRLIVTSRTYRMSSTPDEANAQIDPDNVYLWRMPSRRMEAEVVRDNLLYISGSLDPTMGGPDIDHKLGLSSKRRSLYLRIAAEKEVEFLRIFDGPSVTECYERHPSVMPQQALALSNSELTWREARQLSATLDAEGAWDNEGFAKEAFTRILAREPKGSELELCRTFLERRSMTRAPTPGETKDSGQAERNPREDLVLVLFNHNDFVTIR
jgi:hypothetical protein